MKKKMSNNHLKRCPYAGSEYGPRVCDAQTTQPNPWVGVFTKAVLVCECLALHVFR